MATACREDARVVLTGGEATGTWMFPKSSPPFALAPLLSRSFPRLAWAGAPSRQDQRVVDALARTLTRSDVGFFWVSRGELPPGPPGCEAIWRASTAHVQVSRARIAPVLAAEPAAAVAALPAMRAHREPSGLVFALPDEIPDLGPAGGTPIEVVLAGRAPSFRAGETPAAWRAAARRAGGEASVVVIPDATEHWMRHDDWIAGRAIVHPGVLDAIAAALGRVLRPAWERAARPAGTAIGPSAGIEV